MEKTFRRGIFFSIDAVFALIVSAILVSMAFFALFNIRADAEAALQAYKASADFLSVLEKTGALQGMSMGGISNYSLAAPGNLCLEKLEAKKYPGGESVFLAASVQGCTCPGETISSARSFAVVNSSDLSQSNFIATLTSCRKAR